MTTEPNSRELFRLEVLKLAVSHTNVILAQQGMVSMAPRMLGKSEPNPKPIVDSVFDQFMALAIGTSAAALSSLTTEKEPS